MKLTRREKSLIEKALTEWMIQRTGRALSREVAELIVKVRNADE